MPLYFVSSADGDDGDSGATLDLAWATLEHALEAGGLSAGDAIAIRRTHSEIPLSDIDIAYGATPDSPIKVFGCPRAAHSISSSDWTNGSTSVTVDDNDMDREKHQARYVTAPDGETYLITRVSASNTIIIDREYAGSTVSNEAATIHADDSESEWDDYDDSGDIIKKTAWEADAADLPVIDFNDTGYQIDGSTAVSSLVFKNIEFKDSGDGGGIIKFVYYSHVMKGCLVKQTTQNDPLVTTQYAHLLVDRCTFEGSGSGGSQNGICTVYQIVGSVHIKNSALYNLGESGIKDISAFLENVNLGVEQANGDDDIQLSITAGMIITGKNIKLGGTNGYVNVNYPNTMSRVSIENYQKVLGEHRTFYCGGYYEKAAVSGETPNKKVSDYIVKVTPNIDKTFGPDYDGFVIIEHDIEVDIGAHTFRYWVYNDTGETLNDSTAKDNIWMKAEYVKSYDDTSEYTLPEELSTEIDIEDAADADDWDYLETTVTTAVAGKVRLSVYLNYYHATNNIFIDPAVAIS